MSFIFTTTVEKAIRFNKEKCSKLVTIRVYMKAGENMTAVVSVQS